MLSSEDLAYYKEGGDIKAGGYKVNDIIKYEGAIPYEITQSGGTGVVDKLGVPSGLFYLQQYNSREFVPYSQHDCIEDDLYENLLQMVKDNGNKSKSFKRRKNKNSKKSKKRV